MFRILLPLILLLTQIFFILQGRSVFGIRELPYAIFIISMGIAALAIYNMLNSRALVDRPTASKALNSFLGGFLALAAMAVTFGFIDSIFQVFADYASGSDVIPQIEALYYRNKAGVFPYFPLEQYMWHPYPVYVPLNWWPVGLADLFKCDVRWIGILFATLANIGWGIYIWNTNQSILIKVLAPFLPVLGLLGFVIWDTPSLAVALETLIAGYYLLLACALVSRNLWLTVVAIICCLLSRYTMIFWLPLFILLLWQNLSLGKNIMVIAAIVGAIFFIYIIPFYLKDPTILKKGIDYHNMCYVLIWENNHGTTRSFEEGLNFSIFAYEGFSGTMEHRVSLMRIIQASSLLLVFAISFFLYRKWRHKVNFYDYGLVTLYVFLLVFYITSPHCYRYYYIPFLFVSAVVCCRAMFIPSSAMISRSEEQPSSLV